MACDSLAVLPAVPGYAAGLKPFLNVERENRTPGSLNVDSNLHLLLPITTKGGRMPSLHASDHPTCRNYFCNVNPYFNFDCQCHELGNVECLLITKFVFHLPFQHSERKYFCFNVPFYPGHNDDGSAGHCISLMRVRLTGIRKGS